MKNYVIINGTNSNTLTGLMINELPPITKPEMRTQVEEIDGRDGDIITKLGYSAYDKTITIGLFGTGYDVDNIIKFFNKEGTIVFSNEPDKYYNFTQVNDFDIERLLKFKTASITFHCQPFKYPTIETQKIIQPTILTSDGESITINNTASDSLKLSLKGNTSQASTPTPTSPVAVNVVSGDNTITIANSDSSKSQTYEVDLPVENILKYPFEQTTKEDSGITFTDNGDGSITVNGTATAGVLLYLTDNSYSDDYFRKAVINKQITISGCPAGGSSNTYRLQLWGGGGGTAYDTGNGVTTTFTNTSSSYNLVIGVASGTHCENLVFRPMVEYGSKKNTYQPYGTTPIELCKIGDYQDYIYKDSGKWYLHKEIGKVVLKGSENWQYISVTEGSLFRSNNAVDNATGSDNSYAPYCNNYLGIPQTQTRANNTLKLNIGSNYQYVDLIDNNYNNANNYKTWLGTHNTILYYVLATPINTEITDTNLISQLDAIESAYSYKDQTNISQTNNDKPFIISASAVQSGTNEITINNIGNIYSKPLIALEGNGNVDIYLDDTQILKANVESKMNIDINTLEAYNPDTSALLNRQVIGNYNSMTFQPGNNKLTINGALNKATITNYTRWL